MVYRGLQEMTPSVRANAPTRSSKPHPRAPPPDPRLKLGPVFVASGGVITCAALEHEVAVRLQVSSSKPGRRARGEGTNKASVRQGRRRSGAFPTALRAHRVKAAF